MTTNVLHRSQSAASDVFHTHLLPCYSPEYIQSQGGTALRCYSKVYNLIDTIGSGLEGISSGISKVGNNTVGLLMSPLLDFVCPINPINGNRHFLGISRGIEKMLGDWVFYPLITGGMRATHELLPGTHERIADKVESVLSRLKNANQDLLNPPDETAKFDYRVKTVLSSQINAFAVPAGGMVVFTQLVKEIDAAIKSKAIKETTVEFADGSKARVDLSQVTLEDALAALMGHEMTHVASRHSIVAIFGNLIRTIVMDVGRLALMTYLKHTDKEYEALSKKPASELQQHEKDALAAKEQLYSRLNDVFKWVEEKAKEFVGLFNSRKNEYEADVTGTYFAHSAQFNPLGAIYLQEVLNQNKSGIMDWMHKNLEFFYTHPYGENRKRAILAAITEIAPESLKGRVTWNIANNGYDFERSSPAVKFAYLQSQKES